MTGGDHGGDAPDRGATDDRLHDRGVTRVPEGRHRPSSGHFASAEIEVPARPEEVWDAIATRHGTGAWLFTTDIEEREGGTVAIHRQPFGPDGVATVTAWDPPHRLAFEEPIVGPDGRPGPPLATEFLVEARQGGACVVRVVSGMRHVVDEWEDMIEGAAEGWRMSLTLLRAYLTHFAGRPAEHLDVISPVGRPLEHRSEVFAGVATGLGLSRLAAGDPFRAPSGAPSLAGTIEHTASYFALLRTTEPGPGLVAISTFPMDGATLSVNVIGRLYGAEAAAVVERERPRWQAWVAWVAARSPAWHR